MDTPDEAADYLKPNGNFVVSRFGTNCWAVNLHTLLQWIVPDRESETGDGDAMLAAEYGNLVQMLGFGIPLEPESVRWLDQSRFTATLLPAAPGKPKSAIAAEVTWRPDGRPESIREVIGASTNLAFGWTYKYDQSFSNEMFPSAMVGRMIVRGQSNLMAILRIHQLELSSVPLDSSYFVTNRYLDSKTVFDGPITFVHGKPYYVTAGGKSMSRVMEKTGFNFSGASVFYFISSVVTIGFLIAWRAESRKRANPDLLPQ